MLYHKITGSPSPRTRANSHAHSSLNVSCPLESVEGDVISVPGPGINKMVLTIVLEVG